MVTVGRDGSEAGGNLRDSEEGGLLPRILLCLGAEWSRGSLADHSLNLGKASLGSGR